MSSPLNFHEALRLTASFALLADQMRAGDDTCQVRTSICETASRVAFLRAHRISASENAIPVFGETFRRSDFAMA